jgi:hypothetical protein
MRYDLLLLCIVVNSSMFIYGRSLLRPIDQCIPQMITQWAHEQNARKYTIKDSHIEAYPTFTLFNQNYFQSHTLPSTDISYRYNPEQSVSGEILNRLAQELFVELMAKKRDFTHFTIIQDKNFNWDHLCGFIVFKYKDYPFVLKISRETPETFVNHSWKGFEPVFFFYMGRGAGRHITLFSRIINKELIEQRLKQDPRWQSTINVEMPRKWFGQPDNNLHISIIGTHIRDDASLIVELPSTYWIIADFMQTKEACSLSTNEKRKIVMDLCNYLDITLDPHYNNFSFKQDENGKLSIILVDTESFPMMVGLKEKKHFDSYAEWLFYLSGKFVRDTFLRTKNERLDAQYESNELMLLLNC